MKALKRYYYYLFYKFYKMSEAAPSRWLSDWKAGIVIVVLEIWLFMGVVTYYNIFVDRCFHLEKNYATVTTLIIVIFNYFVFTHNDIWKDYVKEFDSLPREINRRGSWIVWLVVLFIIAFVIFAFYLKSQIDWSKYR